MMALEKLVSGSLGWESLELDNQESGSSALDIPGSDNSASDSLGAGCGHQLSAVEILMAEIRSVDFRQDYS